MGVLVATSAVTLLTIHVETHFCPPRSCIWLFEVGTCTFPAALPQLTRIVRSSHKMYHGGTCATLLYCCDPSRCQQFRRCNSPHILIPTNSLTRIASRITCCCLVHVACVIFCGFDLLSHYFLWGVPVRLGSSQELQMLLACLGSKGALRGAPSGPEL